MGLLWGVIAVGVVIVALWLWMNVRLLRGGNQTDEKAAIPPSPPVAFINEDNPQTSSSDASAAVVEQPRQTQPLAQTEEEVSRLNQRTEQDVAVGAVTSGEDVVDDVKDVEVLPDFSREDDRKVFGKSKLPYILHSQLVPRFTSELWVKAFLRLNQDTRVLGWIAFDDDKVGASDHEYEAGLTQVLSTYRNTVEKLRQEVGLSQVMESSVVGDEGKVWFLAGTEDVWFALFLENQADVHDIVESVLLPVGGKVAETE